MKPIVIYPKDNGDKITLTKKEFEEYLEQAYTAGHTDGYAAGRSFNWWSTPVTYPQTQPNITWKTNTPDTKPNIPNVPYTITCEAHNDLGG